MLRGVVTLRLGEHPGGEIQRGHHAARLTPIATHTAGAAAGIQHLRKIAARQLAQR